jgi:hypothetical protein
MDNKITLKTVGGKFKTTMRGNEWEHDTLHKAFLHIKLLTALYKEV